MPHPDITMATETIHNPSDPRHFMRIKPAGSRIRVLRGGRVLAETSAALRVTEVGRDVYGSTLYIPRSDVSSELHPVAGKTSHCPLKGDAHYFALAGGEPIAWTYDAAFDFASEIRDYVAFYADQVTIEEHGSRS